MKRLVLVLTLTVMIVTAMMTVGGVSMSAAQPDQGGPVCSDRWFKDWYVWGTGEGDPWLYYWWYQFCQNPDGEWFRAYHSWEWWEPLR